MTVPEHLGLFVLGACLVVSLALVAVGAVGVVRRLGALRDRVEGYRELPAVAAAVPAQAALVALRRRVDALPRQRSRALAATAEIETAFKRIRMIAQSVRFVVRSMLSR